MYKIHVKIGHCSYCKNTGIIQRKYSGEILCSQCFINSIEKTIFKTISKYDMVKPRVKIVVALSGGKDSIALLYNLKKIQEKTYGAKPLIALTIDEGIKNYRENSIKVANDFCKKYEIQHVILSFKEKVSKTLDEIITIKKKSKNNKYACNYCATIRRRLLNDRARELGGDVLAMGHNLTDIAETYLMNILFKRFHLISNQYMFKKESAKINQHFIRKITPLMRIPEEEIYLYSNLKNFNYYPSHCPNREKDPILRKRVLEFIQQNKEYSPEIEFNLFNGFLELSEILHHQYKKTPHNSCHECGYPCGKKTTLCSYCDLKNELHD